MLISHLLGLQSSWRFSPNSLPTVDTTNVLMSNQVKLYSIVSFLEQHFLAWTAGNFLAVEFTIYHLSNDKVTKIPFLALILVSLFQYLVNTFASAWGAVTKYCQLGGLSNRSLFSHSFEDHQGQILGSLSFWLADSCILALTGQRERK